MQHKMNRCVVKVVEGRHVHVEGHQFERGDRDSHGGAPGDLRAREGVVATSEDPRRDTDREAGHDERGRGAQQQDRVEASPSATLAASSSALSGR